MADGDDNVQMPLGPDCQARPQEDDRAAPQQMEPSQPELWAELRGLVARAKSGDHAVLTRLREFLSLNPCLWQRTGDVGLQCQAAWVNLIAGPNLHQRECTARRISELKVRWAGDSCSPAEAMLIERIITAWLRLGYIEAREAQHDETSLRWAQFQMQRQAIAEKQLRAAIDALETLRKARRPITVEVRQPANSAPPVSDGANKANGDHSKTGIGRANGTPPKVNGVNRVNGHDKLNGHDRFGGLLQPVGVDG